MHSYSEGFYELRSLLQTLYDEHEAAAIARQALEHVTGRNTLQRLIEKDNRFTETQETVYAQLRQRLLKGEPLQHITGIQWFMGKPFHVSNQVLIPRPETEELVDWIVDDHREKSALCIFDIGTGSGCIAISLKLALPKASVSACDISETALDVAKLNAEKYNALVDLMQLNFLQNQQWPAAKYDIIVSNPPYIPLSEKILLDKNVREFEPENALFVPSEDALLFYRYIARFGKTHLTRGGAIYCETHQDFALTVKELFKASGYEPVILRKDAHDNYRMIKAGAGD